MNPLMRKLLLVAGFVLVTLVIPMLILLVFFDAATSFSAYVFVFGLIIFAILGYVVVSVRDMDKKLEETMDEIKMQNAAIAHKLTNYDNSNNAAQQGFPADASNVKSTANIPLNPSKPLVVPDKKVTDDNFNDFK